MLNELDMEMEKRGLNFVRYADDCIIMVGSEMSANRVMRNISRFVNNSVTYICYCIANNLGRRNIHEEKLF